MLDGLGTPWWGSSSDGRAATTELAPEFGKPLAAGASPAPTVRKPHPLTPSRQVVLEAEEQVREGGRLCGGRC